MADDAVPLASLPDWLDPNQYRAVPPSTAWDKASDLVKALLPQSLQGPTHQDWQQFHANEAAARARGESYLGPTPDQNARTAAAFFGPIEAGSMLPFGASGILKGAVIQGAKVAAEALAPKVAEEAASVAKPSITAYHGSPHDFDRFDISKIGTGEGAQSYGHGLYFAEAEDVAKSYKTQLAGKSDIPHEQLAHQALLENDNNAKAAAASLRARAASEEREPFSGIPPEHMRQAAGALDQGWKPDPGKIYQVSINADPEHFLDWDKPLDPDTQFHAYEAARRGNLLSGNDLSSQMRRELFERMNDHQLDEGEALRRWYEELDGLWNHDDPKVADLATRKQHIIKQWWDEGTDAGSGGGAPTGQSLVKELTDRLGSHEKAAQALHQAGIPGIKYLDQGSRAAGEGSRNYVVFDDKMIDILKKYGLLPLASMGALGAGSQGRLPLSTMQQQ